MNQLAILAMGGQTVTLNNIAGGGNYELEIVDSNGNQVAILNAPMQMFRLGGWQIYTVIPRVIGPAAPVASIAFAGGQYTAVAGGANVITVTIM